jgi:membrane protease YdiL (CAAX protease family)
LTRASRPRAALAAWLSLAALQVGLAIAGAVATESDESAGEPLYQYETAIGGGVVYLVIAALTVLIARYCADRNDALGLRPFRARWVGGALGVVVLAGIVTGIVSALFDANPGEEQGILPETWDPDRAGQLAANAVVIVALGPFAEELFFRGLGVSVLSVLGTTGAVVASGIAFGLAHGLVVGLVPLALFGIGLAWVRVRSTSIWPGFIAHALYNGFVLAIGLYCAANPGLCEALALG